MKKVILQEMVENLGAAGDVVQVSEGYARNFLLPRNLAVIADDRNMKRFDHQKKMTQDKLNRQIDSAKDLAKKIESISCTISSKAGDEDKLFGSITNRDIEEALAKEGITIDRKSILLAEPIRILGVFTVPIRVHKEVTANLKLWVIKE